MLTSQTLVQICKTGRCAAAEDLDTGDVIFDNFSGRYREISRVQRTSVNITQYPDRAPVPIRWGVLGQGIPQRDVCVSPDQKFLSIYRPKDAIPMVQTVEARDLHFTVSPQAADEDVWVDYIALFFEEPCYVVCSGLLMFGYTPDIFAFEQQELRRRA